MEQRALPDRDRREVDRIVTLYEPAIPTTPEVSIQGIRGALALFPSSRTPPDLSGIELRAYVDNHFARPRRWGVPLVAGMAVLAILAGLSVWLRRGRTPQKRVASG
jgi:hypothetical protein